MNQKKNVSETERVVASGGGFMIAALSGSIGVLAGLVLWGAGAHPLIVLVAYLATPAVMILALFLLSLRRSNARHQRSETEPLPVPGRERRQT
ncbi:hypothetical protein LCM08_07685 [Salipiger pacificus]|nr:hypothetical protein [Alloyangia pacifica]MCA0944787.1 hypothetical protein [Alloyangia pacifica]